MKLEKEKLFSLLYNGKISKKQFIEKYFENIPLERSYLSGLFNKAIVEKSALLLEEVLVLVSSEYFDVDDFLEELCALLMVDWHFRHEDIAMMLKSAKHPSTVQCLYKASELIFDYLEYDDTYEFGRKCIKALSAIDNDEAMLKLKLLAKSRIPKIAYYANKELITKNVL